VAETNWVFVERFRGRMRRVTLLDEAFEVISTHDRGIDAIDGEPDECQLLRAVELERSVGLVARSGPRPPPRRAAGG
jgi:hypothetical protein